MHRKKFNCTNVIQIAGNVLHYFILFLLLLPLPWPTWPTIKSNKVQE